MINTFFKRKGKGIRFVIVSPQQKWGGAIALHALCKYISDLGYDSRIYYMGAYQYKKDTPIARLRFLLSWIYFTGKVFIADHFCRNKEHNAVKGCKRKYTPFISRDTIVVYSEMVYGNPLRAKRVVRYLLYYYRYVNDKRAYGQDDLFICYRLQFNHEIINPNRYECTVSYFDLNLYKQYNYGDRKGKCYIVRKGKQRCDLPTVFDGVIIDNLSEEEKVKVFNRCKYCISYDTQTSYSSIAAMCGCISVVVPEPGKKRQDYLSNNEAGYGRAYGFSEEEIDFAQQTASKIRSMMEEINKESKESAGVFVNICQKHFK